MVYGVFGGCYSDWYAVGYFDNREDADKYCCITSCDYYVEPLKDLSGEKILSQIKLKYKHEINFDYQNDKWFMREEPDRYVCNIDDNKLDCNSIRRVGNYCIKFIININRNDRKLAEKIAQDYFAELRSYGDGEIYDKNIKLMNDRFEEPIKEAKRLEKERILREKELAELERLKKKYESSDEGE